MVAPSLPPPGRQADERSTRSAESRHDAHYDAGLIERFNGGDNAAFDEIVTRHRGRMYVVALGLLRNRADAEEIAQDTFIRAHRGLARFRGDSSLVSWLHRITLNLARNRYWYYFRRRRQASLPLDSAFSDASTATLADLIADEAPGPVHTVVAEEFSAIVSACIARLPVNQRDVLTMRSVHHQSYHQMSVTLGVRPGTVKSRVARARNLLRELLRESYADLGATDSPLSCLESTLPTGRLAVVGP